MDRRPDRPAFVDAPTEGMLWGGVSGRRVDAHAQGVGINMCSFSPFRIRWVNKASRWFHRGPSSPRGLPRKCFSIQDPRLIDPGPENRSREQKLRKTCEDRISKTKRRKHTSSSQPSSCSSSPIPSLFSSSSRGRLGVRSKKPKGAHACA